MSEDRAARARTATQPAATAFPWAEAMAFGFGVLRLDPDGFWTMTPRELAAAFSVLGSRRGNAPGRDTLAGLMAAYPDTEHPHG